jgi:hypothetical protein
MNQSRVTCGDGERHDERSAAITADSSNWNRQGDPCCPQGTVTGDLLINILDHKLIQSPGFIIPPMWNRPHHRRLQYLQCRPHKFPIPFR